MRNWIKSHSVPLKLTVPIIILAIMAVFIWGKWIQYEAKINIMSRELIERNIDLDKAQSDMVKIIADSNNKITEIHDKSNTIYRFEMNRRNKEYAELRKHQEDDSDKFAALLNLYINQCDGKLMPRTEFKSNTSKGDKD